jgi:hypothetical protein
MIIWDVTRVLLRYWAVVLVGAVCTAGIGLLTVRDDGVYFTRTELAFLAPTSSLYPNSLRTQSEDIIDTAGVVAKRVMGAGKVTKFAAPEVTLVGLGVREGWSIRLPDTGGQWASNYATQTLVLDVVGPTKEQVQERQAELMGQVEQELLRLQDDEGVSPVNRVTVLPAPTSTMIFHVTGSRIRALGMTAALGASVTVTIVLTAERRRRRRRLVSTPGVLAPREAVTVD